MRVEMCQADTGCGDESRPTERVSGTGPHLENRLFLHKTKSDEVITVNPNSV